MNNKIWILICLVLLSACEEKKKDDKKPSNSSSSASFSSASSSSSNSSSSSSKSSTSSIKSSSSSSSSSSKAKRSVIQWSTPGYRVNGDKLFRYDIGGYEIWYKKGTSTNWETIALFDDGRSEPNQYFLDNFAPGFYTFKLNCFDVDGLYSDFTPEFSGEIN